MDEEKARAAGQWVCREEETTRTGRRGQEPCDPRDGLHEGEKPRESRAGGHPGLPRAPGTPSVHQEAGHGAEWFGGTQ